MKKFLTLIFISVMAKSTYCQPVQISPSSIDKYFREHSDSLNSIEGRWEVSTTMEYYHHDTLYDVIKTRAPLSIAIIKKDDKFQSYNLTGVPYEVEFAPTDVKGVYLYRIYFPQASQYSGTQAVISKGGEMEYTYDFPEGYFGITPGPSQEDGKRVVNVLKWKKQSTQNKH